MLAIMNCANWELFCRMMSVYTSYITSHLASFTYARRIWSLTTNPSLIFTLKCKYNNYPSWSTSHAQFLPLHGLTPYFTLSLITICNIRTWLRPINAIKTFCVIRNYNYKNQYRETLILCLQIQCSGLGISDLRFVSVYKATNSVIETPSISWRP